MKNGLRYIALAVISGVTLASCVKGDDPINRQRNTRNTEGGLPILKEGWSKVGIAAGSADVYFLNDTVGYLSGSSGVSQSIDGGVTWKNLNAPSGDYYNLFFLDAKTGWAVSENTIIHTSDSGKTWATAKASDVNAGYFSDVYFIDEQIGFASAANGIFKSTNGGTNWTKINNSPTNAITLKFSDETHGMVSTAGNTPALWVTSDGTSFTSAQGISASVVFTIQYIAGDPQKAVAITRDGRLWKSTDAGTNWTSDKRFSDDYFDLNFLDQTTGFVCTRNMVFKVEGTNSTMVLYRPIQDQFFVECHFTDDLERGWVVYSGGELYRYVKP